MGLEHAVLEPDDAVGPAIRKPHRAVGGNGKAAELGHARRQPDRLDGPDGWEMADRLGDGVGEPHGSIRSHGQPERLEVVAPL